MPLRYSVAAYGGSNAPPSDSLEAEPSKILFTNFFFFFWGVREISLIIQKEYFAWQRALASGGGAASFGQEFLIK